MSQQAKSKSLCRPLAGSASPSRPTAPPSGRAKVDLAEVRARRQAFLARLVRMSPEERRRAALHGGFDAWQRSVWAARFPEEVPMVNDEFEWIAHNAE